MCELRGDVYEWSCGYAYTTVSVAVRPRRLLRTKEFINEVEQRRHERDPGRGKRHKFRRGRPVKCRDYCRNDENNAPECECCRGTDSKPAKADIPERPDQVNDELGQGPVKRPGYKYENKEN